MSTDDLLASAAPAAGPVVDPKVMPSVIGIHLGTPAREAEALLRREYPKGAYKNYPMTLKPIPEPMVLGFSMNLNALGTQGNDQTVVDVTAPPQAQVVWRVARMTNFMHINRTTLLSSLREKYGKESVALAPGWVPARNDTDIVGMFWLIDERGQRVAAPKDLSLLAGCQLTTPQPMTWDDQALSTGKHSSFDAWVSSSCVGTSAVITYNDRDPQIVELMLVGSVDVPLYLRTATATAASWKAAQDKARQQDLERSKQVKPKL